MNDQSLEKIQLFTDLRFGCFNSDYYNFLANNHKEISNFGLNDYLSISSDKKLRQQEGDSSPTFPNEYPLQPSNLLSEVEELLSLIFERSVILVPDQVQVYSTIFKAFSHKTDAFIFNQFAQTKIQIATDVLRKDGRDVFCLPHNRFDILEEQLIKLKSTHKHVWYLTSSIYSTTGNVIRIDLLKGLLMRHDHLRVLIDDSHGLSWTGKNGQGFACKLLSDFPNVIFTASLCKGFGAEGRVLIPNNQKMRNSISREILRFGSVGLLNTYTLNVIKVAAMIHLSPEIYIRQIELQNRIAYFNAQAEKLQIPLGSSSNTPIGFVYAGKPCLCQELSSNMQHKGFYLSPITYPTLPINYSGLRVAISLYHSKATIKKMLLALKAEYERSLKKRGVKLSDNFISNEI